MQKDFPVEMLLLPLQPCNMHLQPRDSGAPSSFSSQMKGKRSLLPCLG